MAAAVGHKEAKYTQGFHFQQDGAGHHRARQVVERSCTALATFLQEMFVRVEKQVYQQWSTLESEESRQRTLQQLSEIVRGRALLERAVLGSVVCAFAALEDQARGDSRNRPAIQERVDFFRNRRCDGQDLLFLLQANEAIASSNNANRPLLMHLNAQLLMVFGSSQTRLLNSPLAPATLVGGLLTGLACLPGDIAAKRRLFQVFEQEFLARLAVLLNSITQRLEEEGIQTQRAASFDEQQPGPLGFVWKVPERSPTAWEEQAQPLRALLADDRQVFQALPQARVEKLRFYIEGSMEGSMKGSLEGGFAAEGSKAENRVKLLSELLQVKQQLESLWCRAEVHQQETRFLCDVRQRIATQLNAQLEGQQLPPLLRDFFQHQWPEVLFDIAVLQGTEGEVWTDAVAISQQLLESVVPVQTEEQRTALTRQVPKLVKILRETLEQAGFTLAETADFFAQLKRLHLANVQQKLEGGEVVPWLQIVPEACASTPRVLLSEADQFCYQQALLLTATTGHSLG